MPYISWEHYSSLYSEVTEADFDKLNTKASAKMDVFTHMRARNFETAYNEETATDFQKQVHMQIQNTICELINAIHTQETSGMGTGITSVSNDGYSESYKLTTATEKEMQLLSIARNGLSGTGLAGAL